MNIKEVINTLEDIVPILVRGFTDKHPNIVPVVVLDAKVSIVGYPKHRFSISIHLKGNKGE